MTGPVRILALGDSYTIGEGVAAADRWPVRLAAALEAEGFPETDVEIVARTGWTTRELSAGITATAPQGPYDLVTLLVGVNNQFRGLDIDEYRVELAGLLDRAVGFAGGDPSRVVVVSIPDWGVTPFGAACDPPRVSAAIDAFNAVAGEEAERAGSRWVDITPISRRGDAGLIAGDGLHPSAAQYAAWVEALLPAALAALRG